MYVSNLARGMYIGDLDSRAERGSLDPEDVVTYPYANWGEPERAPH